MLDGSLPLSELDDDEIFQGQLKDKNGQFRGNAPEFIPRELYISLSRELRERLRKKFQEAAPRAVEVIIEVMEDGEGEQFSQFEKAGTKRLDAAKYVVDRVLGPMGKEIDAKPAEEESPWTRQQTKGHLLIDIEPDEEDAHLITTAEERRKPIRRKIVEGEIVNDM